MTEFKFACPVCGQHITADLRTSGSQLECPTCFQKIVVPQGPREGDTKFILSAAQPAKPRPNSLSTSTDLGPLRKRGSRGSFVSGAFGLALLCLASAVVWLQRDKLLIWIQNHRGARTGGVSTNVVASLFVSPYLAPTNITWTMDLAKAEIPQATVTGCLSSNGFFCEKATLQGGNLFLAQGKGFPADLGIAIGLLQQSQPLSGRTIVVPANRGPPVPMVVMRWKDERDEPATKSFSGGYALKIIFGQAAEGRLPGKIYIALPDEAKSFAAGAFEAELQKPAMAKP